MAGNQLKSITKDTFVECKISTVTTTWVATFGGYYRGESPLGGTYRKPELDNWHRNSIWCCEKIRMTCRYSRHCNGEAFRFEETFSEVGVYVRDSGLSTALVSVSI